MFSFISCSYKKEREKKNLGTMYIQSHKINRQNIQFTYIDGAILHRIYMYNCMHNNMRDDVYDKHTRLYVMYAVSSALHKIRKDTQPFTFLCSFTGYSGSMLFLLSFHTPVITSHLQRIMTSV